CARRIAQPHCLVGAGREVKLTEPTGSVIVWFLYLIYLYPRIALRSGLIQKALACACLIQAFFYDSTIRKFTQFACATRAVVWCHRCNRKKRMPTFARQRLASNCDLAPARSQRAN